MSEWVGFTALGRGGRRHGLWPKAVMWPKAIMRRHKPWLHLPPSNVLVVGECGGESTLANSLRDPDAAGLMSLSLSLYISIPLSLFSPAPQAAQQERSRNKACLYCDHHASSPDGKDDSGLSSHSWPRSDAQTPLYNREGCSTWCCDFLLQQKI